jgi:Carboxypeptidase regulatory-like domain
MKLAPALLVCFAALSSACGSGIARPGPVINTQPAQVGGTIAGIVKTADSAVAVPGRKVTVIDVKTGQRHETTTAANGGYTIQVPSGTYRFEIELRTGETLAKQPDETHVGNADLDTTRDFIITRTGGY